MRLHREADNRPVRVSWDAEHYGDFLKRAEMGKNEERESAFKAEFPPPEEFANGRHTATAPTTVVDVHGRVIAWYLPDALTDSRKVRYTQALE